MPGSARPHQHSVPCQELRSKAAMLQLPTVFTVSGSLDHVLYLFYLSPFPCHKAFTFGGFRQRGEVNKPQFVCFPSSRLPPRTFLVQNLKSHLILRPHYRLS